MGSRVRQVNDVTMGGFPQRDSKFVNRLLNATGESAGRITFIEVPLEDITPRSINQFRQNRIEKLAKSIRNTNNRLIHPITLVKASDLPKNSDILAAYERKGIDIAGIKYIIVSGERRFRAFKFLKEEEQPRVDEEKEKGVLGVYNPFDTITANVLSYEEAQNENVFYEDSNIQSRQLTPVEAILHVKDVVTEVTSPEEMRNALIEMNGGSEEGIPKSDAEIKKKFRTDRYCAYCLETDLGIEGVSESTIRNHLSILNNCSEKIVDALIAGTYTIREAKGITKFSHEQQEELLDLWIKDKSLYTEKLNELKNPGKVNKKRVTRIDARKRLLSYADKNEKELAALKLITEKLGEYDKEILKEGVEEIEKHAQMIDEIIKKTLENLK